MAHAQRVGRPGVIAKAFNFGSETSGVRWFETALTVYQATSRLTFSQPGVLFWSMDAAAFGKPSKEYLLAQQWQHPSTNGMVLHRRKAWWLSIGRVHNAYLPHPLPIPPSERHCRSTAPPRGPRFVDFERQCRSRSPFRYKTNHSWIV